MNEKRPFILLLLIILVSIALGYSLASIQTKQEVNTIRKVDLNTATKEELKSLPGMGDIKADLIIENRPYQSIYDIIPIEGIGETTFYKIKELLEVK